MPAKKRILTYSPKARKGTLARTSQEAVSKYIRGTRPPADLEEYPSSRPSSKKRKR